MASPSDGAFAQFAESRAAAPKYPSNLVRTETFHHVLASLQAKLGDERVFHSSFRSMYLYDLSEGKDEFEALANVTTAQDLGAHLALTEKDPWWRVAFVQAPGSRDALGCSKDQLTLLLAHHQVMPAFLEFVFTFKDRERPLAHAMFGHENYLGANDPTLRLPRLGRSGIQIQHTFNLLSVERADFVNNRVTWLLRHASLYHSFDVETGRCMWIILKGNRLLMKRIMNESKSKRRLQPASMRSREQSFVASLHVHLMLLEWCAESFGEYIDDLDQKVLSRIVERTKVVVSQEPRADSTLRLDTDRTIYAPRPKHSTLQGFVRHHLGLEKSDSAQQTSGRVDPPDPVPDHLKELEDNFSFTKLQELTNDEDELDRAMLVLKQNEEVIGELREQYEQAVKSLAFTTHVDMDLCGSNLAAFFRRVRNIERGLDMHSRRLSVLASAVRNGKQMFEYLSQYIGERTAKAFSETSSAEMMKWTASMHDIAVRTKQETLSMHIITVFTLIFLPGTFLATFFSSGVLHWDDDGELGSEWVVRTEAIRLFLSVCVPMTTGVVATWAFLYWRSKLRSRRGGWQASAAATLDGSTDERAVVRALEQA